MSQPKAIILIKKEANLGFDNDLIERITRRVLEKLKIRGQIELSLLFCDAKKAKKLNQDYRQMDYVPQVLAFPMDKTKGADNIVRLGDVVICVEKLIEETKIVIQSQEQVLEEWLVHGIGNLIK